MPNTTPLPSSAARKVRRIDYFPDEFLVGTTDLTLEESGAYWKVCSLIYSRGGPIDDDDKWLANAIATDVRKWRPIKGRLVAKGKLVIADGKLSNRRCEAELAKAYHRIDDAHINGAAGGRPRRRSPGDVGEMSARSPGDPPTYVGTSPGDVSDISPPVLGENNGLAKPNGFRGQKPNHQPPTTNHQEEVAATPLLPLNEETNHSAIGGGKPATTASRKHRGRSTMTSKGGGLAALEAFEPTPEQLLKLRAKAPRMAPKLDLLVEQFRTDPYYRKNFEAGKYSDPAATFANFVLREETRALDRGIPVPKTSAGRAVQAGSPEAKAAYDE